MSPAPPDQTTGVLSWSPHPSWGQVTVRSPPTTARLLSCLYQPARVTRCFPRPHRQRTRNRRADQSIGCRLAVVARGRVRWARVSRSPGSTSAILGRAARVSLVAPTGVVRRSGQQRYLCWPLGSSGPVPALVILDMRSPRVFFDAGVSGHWPSRRLSLTTYEYPRCWMLMCQEVPARSQSLQGLVQAARFRPDSASLQVPSGPAPSAR